MIRKKAGGKKRKYSASFIVPIAAACLAAVCAAGYFMFGGQSLEGAETETSRYVQSGTEAEKRTETHKYYKMTSILPVRGDGEASEAIRAYAKSREDEFRDELRARLEKKELDSGDPCVFSLSYDAVSIEGFRTYTFTCGQYFAADSPRNRQEIRRFCCADSGELLDARGIFKKGYDYKAAVTACLSASLREMKIEPHAAGVSESLGALSTSDEYYDGTLALTPQGLEILFLKPLKGIFEAADSYTVPYGAIYSGLAVELPEECRPSEPHPIDPSAEKVIALTFDDGPHPDYTMQLLDLLDKYGVKATFFVVGYNLDYHPETAREIVRRGHSIAIHSTEHKNLMKMTDKQVLADINGMAEKIYDVCGVVPSLVRPMGGAVNQHIADLIARPVIIWDVDPQDWKYRNAEKVSDYVLKHAQSGDIVLSHDIYQSTVDAYKTIIPKLVERGYRFATVEELIGYTDGAYAGKIIRNRSLVREAREAGLFG